MIHIYHGNGKGKTTAAIGAAVRAAGAGVPVIFSQFLKDGFSGEVGVLQKMPGILVLLPEKSFGFTWRMTPEEKRATEIECSKLLKSSAALLNTQLRAEPRRREIYKKRRDSVGIVKTEPEKADISAMIVLDEVLDAVNKGMLDREELLKTLFEMPDGVEIVMTGRDPDEAFLNLASYVTRMEKERHPYDSGQLSRIGVEK